MQFCNKDCDAKRCARCFLSRHQRDLQDQFPWLECSSEPFGVGCLVCRKFYHKTGFKRNDAQGGLWSLCKVTSHASLQRRSLDLHENTPAHQKAVGQSTLGDTDGTATTPSFEQFKLVYRHAIKHPVGEGISAVGGQKKVRKMLWCLSEANRHRKRKLWMSIGKESGLCSTTVFQDVRQGMLCVRFTAANSRTDRILGHMGTVNIARDHSLDAVGLMKGLDEVVKHFCTPNLCPPHLDRQHDPAVDSDLRDTVAKSIETFCSDAASDEIRAGHMLAGQSTTALYLPRFQNLKIVCRDKPHATRRNLSRGWRCDPFLHEVAGRFVFNPDSPTRLIQNSDVFKGYFETNIKRMDPSISAVQVRQHISDLGFAAHRFESASKPMMRLVLFWPACLATLVQISWERKGEEAGKSAISFLNWLTTEKCLQLGMLADAALENIELTRLVDWQNFPLEQLPANLLAFRDRLRALFKAAPPACLSTGCTEVMLSFLRKPTCVVFPGPGGRQETKDIGAPSDAVINSCLSRMGHWVKICEATVKAEFPHFETQQAFSIFNVKDVDGNPPERATRTDLLSQLQRAFHEQDDAEAGVQLERLWHVAKRICSEEGMSSADAWRKAIEDVSRLRKGPAYKALLPLLVRFWAAGASTSGVEQSFSRARSLCDGLQLVSHINDTMEAWWFSCTDVWAFSIWY